jgi:hypothetical protein
MTLLQALLEILETKTTCSSYTLALSLAIAETLHGTGCVVSSYDNDMLPFLLSSFEILWAAHYDGMHYVRIWARKVALGHIIYSIYNYSNPNITEY